MKKTITVNLSGMVFTLDDDAYDALQNYLNAIKEYFKSSGEEEVVGDIESSIAEKFSEKITKGKQVITLSDVEGLIKVMGTVDDIIEEDAANGKEEKKPASGDAHKYRTGRRLYRNTDDAIIAGVASGIAAFFGIDPVIVRLIFGISVLFGGAGVVVYIVLWMVMPKAETTGQKLEMRGEPVTLEALEDLAKAKSKRIKEMDTSGIKRALRLPFKFIAEIFRASGRLFGKFGKLIAVFLGIVIIVSMVLSITAIGFAGAAIAFNYDSEFIRSDIPISEIASAPLIYIGVTATFFVAVVPLFFLLLLGATMVSRKSAFNAITNSSLIGVWMISIIALGLVAIEVAPNVEREIREYKNTQNITRKYEIEDFTKLRIGVEGTVNVVKGEEYSIEAIGEDEVLGALKFELDDSELEITQPVRQEGICLICLDKDIAVEITVPELESFIAFRDTRAEVRGFTGSSTDIRANAGESARVKVYSDGGRLVSYVAGTHGRVEVIGSPDTIDATLEGFGRFEAMDLDAEEVKINQNVLSRVYLGGETDKLIADLEGSARLYSFDLRAIEAIIKAISHSQVEVFPIDLFSVAAREHGRVEYMGDPEIVELIKTEGAVIENLSKYGNVEIRIER